MSPLVYYTIITTIVSLVFAILLLIGSVAPMFSWTSFRWWLKVTSPVAGVLAVGSLPIIFGMNPAPSGEFFVLERELQNFWLFLNSASCAWLTIGMVLFYRREKPPIKFGQESPRSFRVLYAGYRFGLFFAMPTLLGVISIWLVTHAFLLL